MNNINKTQDYVNILKNNHNIILTGAPGTGKTYLAKQIASKLILGQEYSEDTEQNESIKSRVGFVQFHPSYDYTDFVEGLRPVDKKNNNSTIGFVRTDGVFKTFCKDAADVEHREEYMGWRNIVDGYIKSGQIFITNNGNKRGIQFKIEGFDNNNNITIDKKVRNENYIIGSEVLVEAFSSGNINAEWFKEYLNKHNKIFFAGQNAGQICHYYQALYEQIQKDLPFIFIIDEINRGELSKIFGELFYSIDPGYRGVAGRVKTQYQNLVENDDIFKDGFYVPDNVYIIGTMNDIDRSVDSMDFAFRRRFAFIEIKAEDNTDMLKELGEDLKKKAEKRMRALNAAISEIDGLSSAYHIGASYFLKLNNFAEDSDCFKSLWDYHLEGLLREYLRGMPDVEDKVKKLKETFDNAKRV